MRRAALVLVVAACSSSGGGETIVRSPRDFTSGTRLRANVDTIGGGVDVLASFHDRTLGLDCTFDTAGPGPTFTCLPPAALHRTGVGPYFDTTCTEPVGIAPPDGAADFVVVAPASACATAPAVFRAQPPSTSRPYSKDESGVCIRASNAIPIQRLGDAMPLEGFVAAHERIDGAGRIAQRVLVADDGATLVAGGWDRTRNESVGPAKSADGTLRWVPDRLAFVGAGNDRFGDDACSVELASKIGRDALCPLTAAFEFHDACGNGTFRALGAARADARRRDDSGACVAAGDTVLAYDLGPPIGADAFAPAIETDVGGPKAARRGAGEVGVAPVFFTDVVDVKTGDRCIAGTAADGARRCLPAHDVVVNAFADDACTAPAFAIADNGCPTEVPRFVKDATSGRAFAVDRPVPTAFAEQSGVCAPFVPPVTSTFYAVRELDPAALPSVVTRTE
jgi:hypothetical protein